MKCSGIKKELSRARFVLRRSDYRDIWNHLQDAISRLEQLLKMGMETELTRHRHSQRELYRVMQEHSGSVHAALKSVLTCRCAASHKTGLKLMRPWLAKTTSTIPKGILFHVAFSTPRPGSETAASPKEQPQMTITFLLKIEKRG
jgi:hypothetical protein